MNHKITDHLNNIETHADVLMRIPSSEQFIGNIQSVVSVALLDIKRCLEAMNEEDPKIQLIANICRSDKHKDQIKDILRVIDS